MARLTEEMVIARSKQSDLSAIKKLNCWGAELGDVSLLRRMPNVEVLAFSINKIRTLVDFAGCRRLRELYVRKNEIRDLAEIRHLRHLPDLTSLWLDENPCTLHPEYRMTVLKNLPNLEKLDNVVVHPEEVQEAMRKGVHIPDSDDEGYPQQQESFGQYRRQRSCDSSPERDECRAPHPAHRHDQVTSYIPVANSHDEDYPQQQESFGQYRRQRSCDSSPERDECRAPHPAHRHDQVTSYIPVANSHDEDYPQQQESFGQYRRQRSCDSSPERDECRAPHPAHRHDQVTSYIPVANSHDEDYQQQQESFGQYRRQRSCDSSPERDECRAPHPAHRHDQVTSYIPVANSHDEDYPQQQESFGQYRRQRSCDSSPERDECRAPHPAHRHDQVTSYIPVANSHDEDYQQQQESFGQYRRQRSCDSSPERDECRAPHPAHRHDQVTSYIPVANSHDEDYQQQQESFGQYRRQRSCDSSPERDECRAPHPAHRHDQVTSYIPVANSHDEDYPQQQESFGQYRRQRSCDSSPERDECRAPHPAHRHDQVTSYIPVANSHDEDYQQQQESFGQYRRQRSCDSSPERDECRAPHPAHRHDQVTSYIPVANSHDEDYQQQQESFGQYRRQRSCDSSPERDECRAPHPAHRHDQVTSYIPVANSHDEDYQQQQESFGQYRRQRSCDSSPERDECRAPHPAHRHDQVTSYIPVANSHDEDYPQQQESFGQYRRQRSCDSSPERDECRAPHPAHRHDQVTSYIPVANSHDEDYPQQQESFGQYRRQRSCDSSPERDECRAPHPAHRHDQVTSYIPVANSHDEDYPQQQESFGQYRRQRSCDSSPERDECRAPHPAHRHDQWAQGSDSSAEPEAAPEPPRSPPQPQVSPEAEERYERFEHAPAANPMTSSHYEPRGPRSPDASMRHSVSAHSVKEYSTYPANGEWRHALPSPHHDHSSERGDRSDTYSVREWERERDRDRERDSARERDREYPSAVMAEHRGFTRRPVARNSNLVTAVLCLIKELDYPSLEVAEMAIRCRMDELANTH